MRIVEWILLIVITLVPPVSGQSSAAGDPADAVVQVVTYDREPDKDGNFTGRWGGTGFLVSRDGTALTASHVVYRVVHDPSKSRLLAILGKEFYDAMVICASTLPYDPAKINPATPISRDVAKIKLSPSTAFEGRKDTLYLSPKNGPRLEWAKAHTEALSEFSFLTIGAQPERYTHVRTIGFGAISVLPRRWSTDGEVKQTWSAQDGTPMFDVTFSIPPQPGNSGSPVLNDKNEVVGMLAWYALADQTKWFAQASTVLTTPCE